MPMTTTMNFSFTALTLVLAPLSLVTALHMQSGGGGYGYSSGGGQQGAGNSQQGQQQGQAQNQAQNQGQGAGYSGSGTTGETRNGVPWGVGYNHAGGEVSRTDSENAALAPEYHMNVVGTTATMAVGSGGGPPIQNGETPGYVQAKFVTPYGNNVVMHHYGPGYPPPMGQPGGSSGGNAAGGGIANGTVAGNRDLVNWGLTPSYYAEEMGNGAWFGSPSGSSPMPYIGGFND
jgi:transcription initiation factor TFIID subunit TAF12